VVLQLGKPDNHKAGDNARRAKEMHTAVIVARQGLNHNL